MIHSLAIGDIAHYASPYLRGVADGMRRLGIRHVEVDIRQPIETIRRAVLAARPAIVWTHMLLWPPPGAPPVEQLVTVMEQAARAGARVVVHDGDYKERTRHPHPIGSWCALALVNHAFDRSAWRVPVLRWPYFAVAQDRIAAPDARWSCPLWFAGTLGGGPVYAPRTALVEAIRARGIPVRVPSAADGNTLGQTPAIAASADAVLGFGRPEARGWVDTRVFQYPGAGAVLLHDDVQGYLEPWVHFVPYQSGDASSVVEALARLRALPARERQALRERAFAHVQLHHSSVARVRHVLDFLKIE